MTIDALLDRIRTKRATEGVIGLGYVGLPLAVEFARAEQDADRRQMERLEREIAAVGARLKETYDRVLTALDRRIQQAGRAIRTGA